MAAGVVVYLRVPSPARCGAAGRPGPGGLAGHRDHRGTAGGRRLTAAPGHAAAADPAGGPAVRPWPARRLGNPAHREPAAAGATGAAGRQPRLLGRRPCAGRPRPGARPGQAGGACLAGRRLAGLYHRDDIPRSATTPSAAGDRRRGAHSARRRGCGRGLSGGYDVVRAGARTLPSRVVPGRDRRRSAGCAGHAVLPDGGPTQHGRRLRRRGHPARLAGTDPADPRADRLPARPPQPARRAVGVTPRVGRRGRRPAARHRMVTVRPAPPRACVDRGRPRPARARCRWWRTAH